MLEEVLSFGHETNLSGAHPAQSVVDRFEGPNAMSYLRHMQEWFKSFSQKLGRSAEIYKGVDEVVFYLVDSEDVWHALGAFCLRASQGHRCQLLRHNHEVSVGHFEAP